jgi:hypothetical protein
VAGVVGRVLREPALPCTYLMLPHPNKKVPGRVVHKSTGGMLHSIPGLVDLVGNAFR